MPQPERTFTSEFFTVNPKVIPVKFSRPKGKGKPGILTQQGFEGYRLIDLGDKQWSLMITKTFTLTCLDDGYAEVPDTENNRKKLADMMKETISKPIYDRGISKDIHNEGKFVFRDNNGVVKQLNEEALEKGEIRLINKGVVQPPVVKKLKGLREFDVKNKNSKDSDLAQRVRPWKKDFVKVPGAVMEAVAI